MDYWHIDVSTLYELAKTNSSLLLPHQLENMKDYLIANCNLDPCTDYIPMYLLTNRLKIYGASVILYENLLEKIAEELDSSYIVIPSSVHEVLIVPVPNNDEIEIYNNMVQEVNATQLPKDEILSDHAYYYSKKYHVLS